jgi:peptidoglycan glycosyltransferase
MFLNRYAILILTGFFYFNSTLVWGNLNFIKDNSLFENKTNSDLVVSINQLDEWRKIFSKFKGWGQEINHEKLKYKINYTFNVELENFVKSQLLMYRSDHTSVVVINNQTGEIMAAVDYSRSGNKFGREMAFSNSHPAASIFKVITAADLLENTHIKTSTEFVFSGRSTTLYKHQLKEPIGRRFSRGLDLEKAFATSNNVIFGRTAIENLTPAGLKKMAEKFGFNKELLSDVKLPPSVFEMAQDQYNLAELSSGLNNQTNMSPVHGAVIASVVANGGVLKYPSVVRSVIAQKENKSIESPKKSDQLVLTQQSAEDLRTLFMATVKSGTARSSFKRSKYLLDKLEIGGKTGSLTGGEPYGKRDWFVSYAKSLEDKNDKGISICVMIVNQKKWYVKSPLVAKNIMEFYYENIYPQKIKGM